jgi:hypothetical protein
MKHFICQSDGQFVVYIGPFDGALEAAKYKKEHGRGRTGPIARNRYTCNIVQVDPGQLPLNALHPPTSEHIAVILRRLFYPARHAIARSPLSPKTLGLLSGQSRNC